MSQARWEFKELRYSQDIENDLNDLGSAGWDVFHVQWEPGYLPIFLLKRPMSREPARTDHTAGSVDVPRGFWS